MTEDFYYCRGKKKNMRAKPQRNVILQACAYSSYKNRDFFVRQRRYCRGSVEYSGARCTSSTLPYS